jgi:hypothetical protein
MSKRKKKRLKRERRRNRNREKRSAAENSNSGIVFTELQNPFHGLPEENISKALSKAAEENESRFTQALLELEQTSPSYLWSSFVEAYITVKDPIVVLRPETVRPCVVGS